MQIQAMMVVMVMAILKRLQRQYHNNTNCANCNVYSITWNSPIPVGAGRPCPGRPALGMLTWCGCC
eukprot:scaffold510386_cov18-Prasinocladus_malaysianus.AAC.1